MRISAINLMDDYGNRLYWPCWTSYKAAMHFFLDDAVDWGNMS